MNRRNFIASLVLALPLFAFGKKKKKKKKKGGDSGEVTMVSVDDPVAKAVKYVEDRSQVDAKLKIVRSGCAFEKQNCANCMLAKKSDKKDGKIYSCSLFPGKFVKGEAWCQSWGKHPSHSC